MRRKLAIIYTVLILCTSGVYSVCAEELKTRTIPEKVTIHLTKGDPVTGTILMTGIKGSIIVTEKDEEIFIPRDRIARVQKADKKNATLAANPCLTKTYRVVVDKGSYIATKGGVPGFLGGANSPAGKGKDKLAGLSDDQLIKGMKAFDNIKGGDIAKMSEEDIIDSLLKKSGKKGGKKDKAGKKEGKSGSSCQPFGIFGSKPKGLFGAKQDSAKGAKSGNSSSSSVLGKSLNDIKDDAKSNPKGLLDLLSNL